MKKYLSLLFLSSLGITSIATAQDGSHLQTIVPQSVFVPSGFDSNDDAQIVLYGIFTDICHKVIYPKVSIDHENFKIKIQANANVRELCEEIYVTIPYTTTVNLGNLPVGRYEVLIQNNGGYRRVDSLFIGTPKSVKGVDDSPYAYLDHIRYSSVETGIPQVTLYGTIPSSCMTFQEVKVMYKAGNVIDILPILKVTPGAACLPSNTPFVQTVTLQVSHTSPTLLNVRSAGGTAIVQVIDPREGISFPSKN